MNYSIKKQWAVEEENEMLNAIRRGESFDTIAKRHERTQNAIKLRFGMLCKKEIEKNSKNMQDLCKEYNIHENQMTRYINDLETIQKKNQQLSHTPIPSSFDPADISIIKEEILVMNEKIDKIYKHIKKMLKTTTSSKKK